MIRKIRINEEVASDVKNLRMALTKAQNAFRNELERDGYHTEGILADGAAIVDDSKPAHLSFPVGKVTIKWEFDR